MVIYKNSKKAVETGDVVSYIIMFLIIGFGVSILFFQQISFKGEVEKLAPELSYSLPSIFVHTFLNQELTEQQKQDLNLSISNRYFVKDLYIFDEPKYENTIIQMKNTYINFITDNQVIETYVSFSNINNIDFLLLPDKEPITNLSSLPSLKEVVIRNNYYVILPTKNLDKFYVIWFIDDDVLKRNLNN